MCIHFNPFGSIIQQAVPRVQSNIPHVYVKFDLVLSGKFTDTKSENLITAIEAGKAVDIISAQIEKRQLEKQNLEAQIAREKILNPKLEFEQVKFFFQKFLKGDVSDIKFRQALVDTFINKVYLFQDKLCILCNAQQSKIEIPLHETGCSYKGHMAKACYLDTM